MWTSSDPRNQRREWNYPGQERYIASSSYFTIQPPQHHYGFDSMHTTPSMPHQREHLLNESPRYSAATHSSSIAPSTLNSAPPLESRAQQATSSSNRRHFDDLPPSQLTPSCSRCRLKKLKCQFEDIGTHTACTNCLAKGLGHSCHRDLRTPRGKKGPPKTASALAHERVNEIAALKRRLSQLENETSGDDRSSNGAQRVRSIASTTEEIAVTPRKRKPSGVDSAEGSSRSPARSQTSFDQRHVGDILDTELRQDPDTISASPQADERGRTDFDSLRTSASPAKQEYRRTVDSRTSEEHDAATILNALATTADLQSQSLKKPVSVKASLGAEAATQESYHNSYTHSQLQRSVVEATRSRLVHDAKNSMFMDDAEIIRELLRIFLVRANHNIGNVIYGPGIKRAFDSFLSSSADELVESDLLGDIACLSVLMMVLCVSWEFYPDRLPAGEIPGRNFSAINEARKQGLDPSLLWLEIARSALAVEQSFQLKSIAALQAACLFLGRGKGDASWLRMVHLTAINSAQDQGLHRLGRAAWRKGMNTTAFIRLETAVRVWSYLVLRDWCSVGLASEGNLAYFIHPDLCSTRPPLNLGDDDLERGLTQSKPQDVWTPMTFCIKQLELADIVRKGMDLCRAEEREAIAHGKCDDSHPWDALAPDDMSPQNIERMQRLVGQYISELPPFFAIGSTEAEPRIIMMLRWQLHHEIFDLLLGLSRRSLASTILTTSRTRRETLYHGTSLGSQVEPPGITFRRFARSITFQYGRLRRLCPIVDGLVVNYTHVYSACIVTIFDLINRQLQRPSQFSSAPSQEERDELRAELHGLIRELEEIAPSEPDSIPHSSPKEENPVVQAQRHGTQILEGLLAFESEVSRSPVPLHTLDNDDLNQQRQELAAMARRICFEVSAPTSTTAAGMAQKRRKGAELVGICARDSSNMRWPAILLPPEKRRSIPQATILPIVGAWQSVVRSDTEYISRQYPRVLDQGSSWPQVFSGETSRTASAVGDIQFGARLKYSSEDDRVANTIAEWARAMRSRSQSRTLEEPTASTSHAKELEPETNTIGHERDHVERAPDRPKKYSIESVYTSHAPEGHAKDRQLAFERPPNVLETHDSAWARAIEVREPVETLRGRGLTQGGRNWRSLPSLPPIGRLDAPADGWRAPMFEKEQSLLHSPQALRNSIKASTSWSSHKHAQMVRGHECAEQSATPRFLSHVPPPQREKQTSALQHNLPPRYLP